MVKEKSDFFALSNLRLKYTSQRLDLSNWVHVKTTFYLFLFDYCFLDPNSNSISRKSCWILGYFVNFWLTENMKNLYPNFVFFYENFITSSIQDRLQWNSHINQQNSMKRYRVSSIRSSLEEIQHHYHE